MAWSVLRLSMAAIVDQSGAPQDFSSSSWLIGGAAIVGVTYFLTPTWFLDLNYTYAATAGHTANFASPFVDHSSTSVGTLVGNSAWRAETQRVGLSDQQGLLSGGGLNLTSRPSGPKVERRSAKAQAGAEPRPASMSRAA